MIGYEFDMIIWLPLSGLAAALVGLLIAPISVRLKGLNLGLVTLALVFIGSHLYSNLKFITGKESTYVYSCFDCMYFCWLGC